MEFLLELSNLLVSCSDLIFLHNQQTCHVLVLLLQSDYLVIASLILVQKLSEFFFCLIRVLLHLSLNQLRLRLKVHDPFLNKLPSRVKRAYLTVLGLVQSMVEVDERLVLHLAEAAIACAILDGVVQR